MLRYLEEAESDCAIDQQKPGVTSLAQCLTVTFRARDQECKKRRDKA